MEEFKQLIFKHFEKFLVSIILLAAFAGTYLIDEKSIVLNFYYLPVLFASYFLGRRMGSAYCRILYLGSGDLCLAFP